MQLQYVYFYSFPLKTPHTAGIIPSKALLLETERVNVVASDHSDDDDDGDEDEEEEKVEKDDGMDRHARQQTLSKLGFSFIDFPYVQPALSSHQAASSDLVLGIHRSYLADPDHVAADIIMPFVREFFEELLEDAARENVDLKESEVFAAAHPLLSVVGPGVL